MTPTRTLTCRQCRAAKLDHLGRIPPATIFAGQDLVPAWDGGSLYRCRRCQLTFRHPIRSDRDYEGLYASAPETIWVSAALRPDQLHVRQRIESAGAAASVLDVGCYDGALLDSLGPSFRKFGVEASAAARQQAQKKGIEIVAATIRELAAVTEKFDVICAVDVIEHVSDPRAFVSTLADRLLPNGTLIVSTGTPDVPAWRFAGGRYWYCSFPEHISFTSQAWARAVAAELGLELVEAHRFAYSEMAEPQRSRMRRSFFRKVARAKFKSWFASWTAGEGGPPPPNASYGLPGLFDDHLLISFKKTGASSLPAAG